MYIPIVFQLLCQQHGWVATYKSVTIDIILNGKTILKKIFERTVKEYYDIL